MHGNQHGDPNNRWVFSSRAGFSACASLLKFEERVASQVSPDTCPKKSRTFGGDSCPGKQPGKRSVKYIVITLAGSDRPCLTYNCRGGHPKNTVVPIVRGAPAVESFLPHDHNFCDFAAGCIWEKSGAMLPGEIRHLSMAMSDDQSPLKPRLRGTSRTYLLDRLRRGGHHDWLAAIATGKVSVYSAGVELGWIRRPPRVMGERSNQSRRRRFNIGRLIG
jgi:hypothetical protein